jgi:hypothetical protein
MSDVDNIGMSSGHTPPVSLQIALRSEPVSDPALVVSICSATFTGGGLIAQYLLHHANGARLKVQLVFCYRTDWSMTVSATGSRRRLNFERMGRGRHIGLGIEYANVRVTNIGRTPVSVENISFDLGHERWFRRWRSTVVPMQFIDSNDQSAKKVDLSPQRLDPGDNITRSFHLWPTLGDPDQFKHRKFRRLVVRGSAQAVGRRATRSRRRDAWRFRKGELSTFNDIAVPCREIRVYRALWHHSYNEMFETNPVWYHGEIVSLLKEGKSHEEIRAYLDGQNTDPKTGQPKPFQMHHMVAYDAHHAFHKTSANPLWPDVDPPKKLTCSGRAHRLLWGQRPRN